MKNLIKKIGQNKFQFFFFVGILSLLVVALIISSVINNADDPIDDTPPTIINPSEGNDEPTDAQTEESLVVPFANNMDYVVTRKFYDKNASKDDQIKSLIKYGNTYRTSSGTSFSKKDNTEFDVLAALSGKVVEIKTSPLYGNYVVVEHTDKLKTRYYGLSQVNVKVGDEVAQGDKLGVSGDTDIDKEAGNHVYFQIIKDNKYVNPETLFGKKLSEI